MRKNLREHRIEVAGQRGCFTETGRGPPVVLLASVLVLARSYRPTAEALARSFRVLTVEMPGSGSGSLLPAPWGVDDYARWAAGFLDVLRIERAAVIGHSNSGAVALTLGALRPERVRSVVLADAVGGDRSPSLPRILLGRGLDSLLEFWLGLRAWHHVVYNLLGHTRNFLGQVRQAAQVDLRPVAPRVRAPVLLAWGARDHTTPLRDAEALCTLLPRPTLYVSRTGSHDWIIDHAAEFAAAFRAFVMASERTG